MVLLLSLLCSCAPSTSSEVPSTTPSAAPTPTLTPAPTAVAASTASETAQLDNESPMFILTDDTYKCGDDFPAGSYIFIPFSGACTFAVMRKDFSMDVNLALVSQSLLESIGYTVEEVQEEMEDVELATSILEPITFEEGDYLYIIRALDDEEVKVRAYLSEAGAPEEVQASSEPGYELGEAQVTIWTSIIGSQWMQTIIPITNTGDANLFVDGGSFDIEGADGSLIGVQSYVSAYPQVLAPGEVGYIYENTTMETVIDGDPVIVPHPDIDVATVDFIRFETSDISISDEEYGGIKAIGRVKNTTDSTESMVYVAIALYDESGNVIDIMYTVLADELPAGDQIGFEMSSFSLPGHITAAMVADYDVWAYPLQMQF